MNYPNIEKNASRVGYTGWDAAGYRYSIAKVWVKGERSARVLYGWSAVGLNPDNPIVFTCETLRGVSAHLATIGR
jgi:hypothetical protein